MNQVKVAHLGQGDLDGLGVVPVSHSLGTYVFLS